jgi:hypothetical protein
VFRPVTLPEHVPGRLYLHSMPGRHEKFEAFLSEAERVHLDLVVCLAAENEVRRKSPAYFAARVRRCRSGSWIFRSRITVLLRKSNGEGLKGW